MPTDSLIPFVQSPDGHLIHTGDAAKLNVPDEHPLHAFDPTTPVASEWRPARQGWQLSARVVRGAAMGL
jgi:hypothetical protein